MTKFNVSRIKAIHKEALAAGKIVYTAVKLGHLERDFSPYLKRLNADEWNQFEEAELLFRKRIASRSINHGDFVCRGNINLWIKVAKIVSSIFYMRKEFRLKRKPNQPWNANFVKYCCRVVKSFPRDQHIDKGINTSSIEFLQKQLFYINNTIRPYFTLKGQYNDRIQHRVCKEKACLSVDK